MSGLLSKLIRVSDKAAFADAFCFWSALAVVLGIMFFAEIAFIASVVGGVK